MVLCYKKRNNKYHFSVTPKIKCNFLRKKTSNRYFKSPTLFKADYKLIIKAFQFEIKLKVRRQMEL